MLILLFRELKAIFRDIKSVIALFLMTLTSGILFAVSNLSSGYPAIEPVSSVMTIVAALVVPLVAIFLVSRERKDGSEAFIATMPFTSAQTLLGKFFALLIAAGISLGVIAICPLVLGILGASGSLRSYPGILLLYAMIAFLVAMGLMFAYAFKKTWVAIATSYLALALLFVLGSSTAFLESLWGDAYRWLIDTAEGSVGMAATLLTYEVAFCDKLLSLIFAFFELISPFKRYDPTVFGLFDLSSLIFYLSLTVVLLLLAYLGMKKQRECGKAKRKKPVAVKASVATALIVVVCLAVNIVAAALPSRFMQLDVSTNSFYSLSDSTKSFLKSLDRDVTVYMIDKSGADESVIRYVERYCEQSDRITLEEINTAEDTEFLSEYGLDGQTVPYCSLIVKSDTRWRIVSSEDFFTYYHEEIGYASPSELEYYISYYSQMYQQYSSYISSDELQQLEEFIYSLTYDSKLRFKAEQSISEAIEYVCEEYIPTVYFLSGRGEKNTSANPLEIKGLTRIPDDVGLLIVNSPDEDYSNSEVSVLLEFAERGGRIIFITNEANQSMPNLGGFLGCYGLFIQSGTLSEGESNKIGAVSNTSDGTKVSLVGASDIKTVNVGNVTVEPLLTFDVKEAVDGEEKTVTKTVAAVAYENQQPTVALVTGADTFNVTDTENAGDEEKQEYLVAMSFLQSITSGMKKGFESELTFDAPKSYATEMLTVDTLSAIIFGVLLVGLVPLALLIIPTANILARKIRDRITRARKTK